MQHDLAMEAKELQCERGKQERLASGITNQMHADAQVAFCIVQVDNLVAYGVLVYKLMTANLSYNSVNLMTL